MDKEFLTNLSYATFLSFTLRPSTGSGFRITYNGRTFLITAKHVLYDENDKLRGEELLVTSQNSKSNSEEARTILIKLNQAKLFRSNIYDIAGIEIEDGEHTTVQQEGSNIISVPAGSIRKLNDIVVSNDVFLVGFPTSLIVPGAKHFEVNRPLLRKGIIAGVNLQENSFIIDCSSYYGNSGAPIIELGEDAVLRLIGIVIRYIPFVTEWRNNREPSISHAEFANSGYSVCLPLDIIIEIIDNFINS